METNRERAKRNFNKKKQIIEEYKSKQSCHFCGENTPICLDFHHFNPNDKEFQIGFVCKRWSLNRTFKEIKKCIVICANCHAKLHGGIIHYAI